MGGIRIGSGRWIKFWSLSGHFLHHIAYHIITSTTQSIHRNQRHPIQHASLASKRYKNPPCSEPRGTSLPKPLSAPLPIKPTEATPLAPPCLHNNPTLDPRPPFPSKEFKDKQHLFNFRLRHKPPKLLNNEVSNCRIPQNPPPDIFNNR